MGAIASHHSREGASVISVLGGKFPDGLGATPNTLVCTCRGRMADIKSRSSRDPEVGVFYNGYGLELGIGQAYGTVIAYLHTDYPGLRRWVEGIAPQVDGIITVNDALLAKIRGYDFRGLENRLRTVPYPVVTPAGLPSPAPARERPLILGYAGRIEFSQKRLERMLPIVQRLEASGLDYRFEFLGDGADSGKLKNLLRLFPRVKFLGHQEGTAYWECLQRWRHIVFTSDFEGLPIALLEAVSRGVVPIYPRSCMGSDWVEQLQSGLSYEVKDPDSVVEVVKCIQAWSDADWKAFTSAASLQMQAHSLSGYLNEFHDAVKLLSAMPRLRGDRKSRYPGWLPLWVYHRVQRRRLQTC